MPRQAQLFDSLQATTQLLDMQLGPLTAPRSQFQEGFVINGAAYNQILIFDTVNGNLLRNATNDANYQDLSPSWSADGVVLAIQGNGNGQYGIFVMNAQDSSNRQLLINGGQVPSWKPSFTSTPTATPTRTITATPTLSSTPFPDCLISTKDQKGIAFRYVPSKLRNDPLFYFNSGLITLENNFPGQWSNVTGSTAQDWIEGTQVSFTALSLITQSSSIWLKARGKNTSNKIIDGYIIYRDPFDSPSFVNLSCSETSLPGGPTATPQPPTPGPSPTPNALDWYVICTLRPGEQPPIEVRVRTDPNVNATILAILNPGSRVRRISLLTADEVISGSNIFVQIEWAPSSTGRAWVARQDSLGALIKPQREVSCPVPTATPLPTNTPQPTGTQDSSLQKASPGRFANPPGGYGSPFMSGDAPANVGSYGIHDFGTIDVMPANLEECIDTSSNALSTLCNPPNSTLGIPIFAPVGGTEYIDDGRNIILFWEISHMRNDIIPPAVVNVRREIVLAHLDGTNFKVNSSSQIQRGALLGYLCRHENRAICHIPVQSGDTDFGFVVNHLGVQVRFRDNDHYQSYAPTDQEVLGVLAIPNCIFDKWYEDHLVKRPKNPQIYAACP